MDASEYKKLIQERAKALERFAEWEAAHHELLNPQKAIAYVGALYELIPPESRQRKVDVSGVQKMHRLLRAL